jgi:secreted PhoX family phosphatase
MSDYAPEILAKAKTLKAIHEEIAKFWKRNPLAIPELIPADDTGRLWIVTDAHNNEYPTNTMRVVKRGSNYFFEREF